MEVENFEVLRTNQLTRAICKIIGTRHRVRAITVRLIHRTLKKNALKQEGPAPSRQEIIKALKMISAEYQECSFIVGRRRRESRFLYSQRLIEFGRVLNGGEDQLPLANLNMDPADSSQTERDADTADNQPSKSQTVRHLISLTPTRRVEIELPADGLSNLEAHKLTQFIKAFAS